MRSDSRPRLKNVDGPKVGERKNAPSRFRRLAHLTQVGVRRLAAHERDVLKAGHGDVGDEHSPAVEVTRILLAQQAGADPACGRLVIAQGLGQIALRILFSVIVCDKRSCQRNRFRHR
jgi:hypothetical protein